MVAGVALAADSTEDSQFEPQVLKMSIGSDALQKVLDLKNLVPAVLDVAKNISNQLRISGFEAMNIVLQTIASVLRIFPTLIKQIPNFTVNFPAIMKRLPPVIDALKIVIEAAPEMTKTLPEFVDNLPELAKSMVPTLKSTPDLLTVAPVVIKTLPDLRKILFKLIPVINVLNHGSIENTTQDKLLL